MLKMIMVVEHWEVGGVRADRANTQTIQGGDDGDYDDDDCNDEFRVIILYYIIPPKFKNLFNPCSIDLPLLKRKVVSALSCSKISRSCK